MKMIIPKEKFNRLIQAQNFLIGIIVFLILVLVFFLLNLINANKINLGMRIAGVPVSGLSVQEAQEKMGALTQQFLEKEISLNYEESFWQTNFKNLGIEIDVSTSVNSAFDKGHQRNKFLVNSWWQVKSLFMYNIKPSWQINDEKLEKFFQDNLTSIHQPAKNASFVYDEKKKDFIILPSQRGVVIDKDIFKKDLAKNINKFSLKNIELYLVEDRPEILESETQKAYKEATAILSFAPFELTINDEKEKRKIDTIDQEILLRLISFKPVLALKNSNNKILGVKFNQEEVRKYLTSLAPLVNKKPINAQLAIKNNRVVTFALSHTGIKLEIENNIPLLSQGILENKKEIELKTINVQPEITTKNINNLGITKLLAKGVSNFSGSPLNRIHNIELGTAKFNGTLLKPEEEFSFNTILGEIGPEQGYKPELVIKRAKTIPEYGGGICQVSTTAFRAATRAGLPITERYPHAFPVKYYNPQGFDATIYPPHPDFRFVNNTPGYLLIQTKIENYYLTFEFYGADDGREVKIDGPFQYDSRPDGSIKAKFTRKIYKDNKLIEEKTFYSNYKSPALYPIERNPLE